VLKVWNRNQVFETLPLTARVGDRLDLLLQSVGVTPASLSQVGSSNLNFLTSLADELDCKDTDLSSYGQMGCLGLVIESNLM
jgi:hypothetical protein